jgi:NAD(P)H-dependent FMN reductase
MSIHVIGFNGSPRRDGNLVTLMGWVLEGCAEAGASVEWIHVVDHDIRYCQGCFACLRTGVCPIQDDFLAVRDRLLAADGLVVGSPVYEGQPTAQLKTFMDRVTLLNLYTATFRDQHTLGVATSGTAPTGGVARGVATLFGRCHGIIGARTADSYGYPFVPHITNPRLPARARALGRRLVSAIRSPRRPLISLDHLWIAFVRRFLIRPLAARHPDQVAGVLRIWQEKGWW